MNVKGVALLALCFGHVTGSLNGALGRSYSLAGKSSRPSAAKCADADEDDRALERLFERISPRIEATLLRFLRSDADAASAALQDAWSAASQRLSEYESAEHLIRWLHRVARCRAITTYVHALKPHPAWLRERVKVMHVSSEPHLS